LRLPNPYKQFSLLVEQENFEPLLSWGLRMAIASTIPVIWGVATGQMAAASWITLTAECICWVELKGSFGQSIRVLLAGVLLALLFTFAGSVTGNYLWLSLLLMLAVGFIGGLFKNLGDRANGLSVSVFVLFIIANAYPTGNIIELQERMRLVLIGGLWNTLIGTFIIMLIPAREPYRRTIGLIWRAIADLVNEIAKGWGGDSLRSSPRDIYLKEKEVRSAIDTSLHYYETPAHKLTKKDGTEFELAQVRKATALVAAHITAVNEELENLNIGATESTLRLKLYAAMKALQQAFERMAVYIVTLKPEEELLLSSRINRLNKLVFLLKEYLTENNTQQDSVRRAHQLIERTVRITERCITLLQEMGTDQPVYRSYSLIKTILILHPKHLLRNLRLLFDLNTFTARYALRVAIAATLALFVAKSLSLEHGYWLPFTVIIVSQPYFGATIKKAIDRVLGTVFGGIAGGLLLYAHTGVWLEVALLFLSFILMVYFIRSKYSVAAFFITFSLVVLFNIEMPVDLTLIWERAFATIGGALFAIIAGFILLPYWDKKWLPVHLAKAISSNYNYFLATFFSSKPITNWTRLKRDAETKNSNAFDSFNRYMQEPAFAKKSYGAYYHLITHSVRLTRELNSIHLEQEHLKEGQNNSVANQQQRVGLCLFWFKKNMELIKNLDHNIRLPKMPETAVITKSLSSHQSLYLDRMIIELKAMHTDLEQLINKERTND
jgi:uncharacterized membrane protein YccC